MFSHGNRTGDLTWSGARQVAVVAHEAGPARYYCELYDNNSFTKYALTYTYDGVGFGNVDSDDSSVTQLRNQPVELLMIHGNTDAGCVTSWPGSPATIVARHRPHSGS